MASAILVDVWTLCRTSCWAFFLLDCRTWICVSSLARCARARASVTSWVRYGSAGFWGAEPCTGEWDTDMVLISPFPGTGCDQQPLLSHPLRIRRGWPLTRRQTPLA